MRKFVICWALIVASGGLFAQEIDVKDTLPENDLIKPFDTIGSNFELPTDVEFIPANATPELVSDRLSCLQKDIELTYNKRVHGFIDYFTIRDREYTRMVQRRKDLYFPIFERKLKEYGLPDELKYLSIIELTPNMILLYIYTPLDLK